MPDANFKTTVASISDYAGLGKPDGLCDGAWRTIHPYVFALANACKGEFREHLNIS